MSSLKNNLLYILLFLAFCGCNDSRELDTHALIESALSDALASGIKVEYVVKSDIASKDEYQLSDGTILPCLPVEAIFIQNYSHAIKVVNASKAHVDLSFLSESETPSEPVSRKILIGDDVISYRMY